MKHVQNLIVAGAMAFLAHFARPAKQVSSPSETGGQTGVYMWLGSDLPASSCGHSASTICKCTRRRRGWLDRPNHAIAAGDMDMGVAQVRIGNIMLQRHLEV